MASEQDQIIDVYPRVIVGLGGTGKEILLRLRMKFFERYGVSGYPCISYLWVDTDIANQDVERKDLTLAFNRVLFSEEEKVDLRVSDPSKFLDNPSDFPWITNWIPPAIVGQGLKMQYGAGQVRAKGRFALFSNFKNPRKSETIKAKLERAARNVRDGKARSETTEFSDKKALNLALEKKWGPQVNFFVIVSLAGGTGSGTFLDVAFLIRKIASDEHFKADVTGLLCLASLFTNDSRDRTFGNCYAALKELEHYNFAPAPGARSREMEAEASTPALHKFEDRWEGDYPDKALNGPPFDSCYLIDGYTYGGTPVTPDRRYEVFDMVAEYLFWDFYRGTFAGKKRTLRPNNRNFLDVNYYKQHKDGQRAFHTQSFSTSYSSFGLSWISVPLGSRIGACASRLAHEILEFWKNGGSLKDEEAEAALKSRNLVQEVRKLVASDILNLTASKLVEQLATTSQGMMLSDAISEGLDSYFRELAIQEGLRGDIRKFEEQYLASKKGGIINEAIETNRSKLVQNYMTGREGKNAIIPDWILKVLQEEGFIALLGFPFKKSDATTGRVDGYIDVLINVILPEVRNELRGLKERFSGERSVAEEKKERFLNNIEELDTNFVLYKGFSRKILLGKCKETELSYAVALVSAWVCDVVLTIIDDFEKNLDKTKGTLEAFQNGILKETIADFRRLREHYGREDRRILSIFLYEDLGEYYRLGGKAVDIRQEKEQLFRTQVPQGWEILKLGKDNLKKELEDFVWKRFQDDFQERFSPEKREEELGHAVKLFNKNYPKTRQVNRSNTLQIFLGGGKPYVQPTHTLEADVPRPHEDIFIGVSDVSRESDSGGLIEELKAGLGDVQAMETEKEAVLYYHELTGLPLFYLSSLGQYRQAYDHFQRQMGVLPLHTDKRTDKFPDVYLYPTEEARSLFKVWEMVLLGAILRVLQVEIFGDDFRYFYYKGRAAEPEVIGDERGAVRTILESFSNYAWCLEEIQQRKEGILEDPDKVKIYAGLLWIYNLEIFRGESASVSDGASRDLPSFQSSVVKNLIQEVEDSKFGKTLPLAVATKESSETGHASEWRDFIEQARKSAVPLTRERDRGLKDTRYVINGLEPFVRR